MNAVEFDTPRGPGRVRLYAVDHPQPALVLGHGAGGGVEAPDLVAAREAGLSEHVTVALVEQPYRVLGRRSPPPVAHLDTAWIAIVKGLRARDLKDLPLIVGGRSLGGRVACRTAESTDPLAVLCLAFPLQPPARAGKTPPSRLEELEAVTLPTLVVQGERDRFGIPPPGPSRDVVTVPGDHGLKTDPEAVGTAVRAWLASVVGSAAVTAP